MLSKTNNISKEAENHLNSLEKAALINHIKERAGISQENRRLEAIEATKNSNELKDICANFKPTGAPAPVVSNQKAQFDKRKQEENKKLADIGNAITKLQATAETQKKDLVEAEAIQAKASKKDADTLAKAITEENLKTLNKMLDDDRNEDLPKLDVLQQGLETFVALLRDRKSANNIDVKLYLESHAKLAYKLNNIEAMTLTLANVMEASANFSKIKSTFNSDVVAQEYTQFTEWGVSFAEYATKVLKAGDCRSKLQKTQAEIAQKNKERIAQDDICKMFNDSRLAAMLDNRPGANTIEVEGPKTASVAEALQELKDRADNSAAMAQKVNFDYGASYFTKLQKMRTEAQEKSVALAPTAAPNRKTRKSTFNVSLGADGQASAANVTAK